jgi:hypothetical protein
LSVLLALCLVAAAAPAGIHLVAASPKRAPQVYQLALAAAKQDYFLPAPRQRRVLFKLDARQGPPKARLMFRTPLPAGTHHFRFQVTGADDRTLVIAVPLASGRSSVTVQIEGAGRYDFGFWTGDIQAPVKEYRFTVQGPLPSRTFELELPAAPRP